MIATVAVPHYKSHDSLHRLLVALNDQQSLNFNLKDDIKVIVINDDLEPILKSQDFVFENLNLKIINQENQGVATARNKAISLAEGEFVFFLDVDCVPSSNWLQTMIESFNKDKQIDGIGGRVEPLVLNGVVNEYYNLLNFLKKPIIDSKTGEIVIIITANCGFRLDKLKKIEGFDQKLFYKSAPGGEDLDLTYRFKQEGFTLQYEENALVLHSYPTKFFSILKKNINYGRGMARFCLARKIDPKIIRQPRLNFFSFIAYNLKFLARFKRSFLFFHKKTNIFKSALFAFFESLKYSAHSYGMISIKK